MKKVLSGLLVGAMAFSLLACGGQSQAKNEDGQAATGKTVLKLAFNQSEDHPQFKALTEMSKELEEKTEGRYSIEISPNATLGNQKDSFELVQSGTIQMAMVANSIVENVNPDFAVLGLPYLYDSGEHQKKVFTSGVLDDIFATTSDHGFNVMAAFTAGARSVYCNKPIHTPEDLNGLKVRVMQSPTCIEMLNAMGGVGTPMPQGEVYTAIQQGTIDAGENNEITYADLKHYEVAPVYSYTRHLMIPDLLIMNSKVLNDMSEADRKVMHDLCKSTTELEFKLWNEKIDSAIKEAKDHGSTFVEVDIKPFQDNCKEMTEKIISESAGRKELYTKIRELAQ